MPAQTSAPRVPAYALWDTAPPLSATLCDDDGEPIDLTAMSVAINIAYSRGSYGYSPEKRLVDGGVCLPDPDQVLNKGKVIWQMADNDLSSWGSFRYNFEITDIFGKRQTVSPIANNVMQIEPPLGGVDEGRGPV